MKRGAGSILELAWISCVRKREKNIPVLCSTATAHLHKWCCLVSGDGKGLGRSRGTTVEETGAARVADRMNVFYINQRTSS